MITLKHFLARFPHPGFGATAKSIYERRSRARKLGLPDPYPFLIDPPKGVRGLIVVPEKYKAWSYPAGKPPFDFGRGGEGR